MKIITETEYTAATDEVLQETFELIGHQRFYLEVLSDEENFFGRLIDYSESDSGLFNASYVFERNETTGMKYSYENVIESGRATVSYYAYENYDEAVKHGFDLLAKHR